MNNDIRVFFVVDSVEDNEEIFETFAEAEKMYRMIDEVYKPRLYVALVEHAYKENDMWTYSDQSDTFDLVKVLLPIDY